MSANSAIVVIVVSLAALFLFGGTPDLMDALIQSMMYQLGE